MLSPSRIHLARAGLLLFLAGLWQLLWVWGLPAYVLSPVDIVRHFFAALGSEELYQHIGASLLRSLPGFAIGTLLGVALGLLAGVTRPFEQMLSPVVFLSYPVPKIVMLPLFMLWFGIGDLSKILIIALACFYPMYINAYYGAKSTSALLVWSALSMGARGAQRPVEPAPVSVAREHCARARSAPHPRRPPDGGLVFAVSGARRLCPGGSRGSRARHADGTLGFRRGVAGASLLRHLCGAEARAVPDLHLRLRDWEPVESRAGVPGVPLPDRHHHQPGSARRRPRAAVVGAEHGRFARGNPAAHRHPGHRAVHLRRVPRRPAGGDDRGGDHGNDQLRRQARLPGDLCAVFAQDGPHARDRGRHL